MKIAKQIFKIILDFVIAGIVIFAIVFLPGALAG